jgi:hypothetical protein
MSQLSPRAYRAWQKANRHEYTIIWQVQKWRARLKYSLAGSINIICNWSDFGTENAVCLKDGGGGGLNRVHEFGTRK